MKHTIFLTILISFSIYSQAQLTPEQRIQDSVIGWWGNTRYDKLKPQTDAVSKRKEATLNKLLAWMKQSYTPVAGLGTYSRYIGPIGYGIQFAVWNVSHNKPWTDAQGHFTPIPEENQPFWISTNKVWGAWDINFINKPGVVHYFVMQPNGYYEGKQTKERRQGSDPRIDPNVYQYVTWVNNWCTVYLAPNNQLPMIPVTKGELLQVAANGLDGILKEKRKYVEEHWPDNKKAQDDAFEYEKKEVDKYRNNIAILQQRYRNRLSEPAVLRTEQPDWNSFETDPDIFVPDKLQLELNHAFPVYKMDETILTKMKGEQPLCVSIAFPYANKNDGNRFLELYTALSKNLNYEYIYNYFFDSAKIKGKPYAPANEQQLQARLNAYRNKNNASLAATPNNVSLPANVHFMESFATSAIGSDPQNWFFRKTGTHHVIATPAGKQGKWLRMGYNNETFPSILKRPIPENFSLDFDLASDYFTTRTGGALDIYMSTRPTRPDGTEIGNVPGKSMSIRLTAGNNDNLVANSNYDGKLQVEIHSNPIVNTENYSEGLVYNEPQKLFHNKALVVHVTIQIKNGQLKVLVNDQLQADSKKMKLKYGGACINCDILKGSAINILKFKNMTNDWKGFTEDKDVSVYISNIKITKE